MTDKQTGNSFKTLKTRGLVELIEKKSRFIGVAEPVTTEEDAASVLNRIRKEHNNANHNVYAYIIGNNGSHIRYSDDGEPSGSAAAPILNVLKGQGITNAIVIVTRYFGGTLLGTGGLVRAYGQTAKEAVTAAEVITCVLYDIYDVRITYPLLSRFQYELDKKGYSILNTSYTTDITLTVQCQSTLVDEFQRLAADLSSGSANVVLLEQCFR